MNDPAPRQRRPSHDDTDVDLEDVLEALNAEGVVEHPGTPTQPAGTPASDADAPPPPG